MYSSYSISLSLNHLLTVSHKIVGGDYKKGDPCLW